MPKETKITQSNIDSGGYARAAMGEVTAPNFTPAAEATHAIIDPGNQGISEVETMKAFADAVNHGTTAYGVYKHKQDKLDVAEGQAAKMQGVKREDVVGKSEAFIRGYEQMDGRATVLTDINTKVQDFYEKNKGLPSEELQKGISNIFMKEFNGRSTAFMQGAMPEAMATMHSITNKHTAYITAEMNDKTNQKLLIGLDADIQRAYQEVTGHTLNEVTGRDADPEKALQFRKDYIMNGYKWDVEIQKKVAAIYGDRMARLQEMGITDRKAAGQVLGTYLGNMGKEYGISGIARFAEEAQSDGIRPIDTPSMNNFHTSSIIQGLEANERYLSMLHTNVKKFKEEKEWETINSFYSKLLDPNFKDYGKLIKDLDTPENQKLMGANFHTVLNIARQQQSLGNTFAKVSDGTTWMMLASRGPSLSIGDVVKNSSKLSKEDAQMFLHGIAQVRSQNVALGQSAQFFNVNQEHSTFSTLFGNMRSRARADINGLIHPELVQQAGDYAMRTAYKQYATTGHWPTGDDWTKIEAYAMEKFGKGFAGTQAAQAEEAQKAQQKPAPAPAAKPQAVGAKVPQPTKQSTPVSAAWGIHKYDANGRRIETSNGGK